MISKKMYELGSKRSSIRDLFEYGKERAAIVGKENVFDFSIGNPSVPSPQYVKDALLEILSDNPASVHGYTSAQGDEKTRQAIADDLNSRYSTTYRAENIFMTCGAAASLAITFRALCETPEDEFIAIAPFFPEYKVFVEGSGARFQMVSADVEAFQINFEELEALITKNTKGIIVNSPNNPSGAVYSIETIKMLCALLKRKSQELGTDIFIISDEPYREIVYEKEVPNILDFYDNAIMCYSYSKSLSLPGERIGYVLIPDSVKESKSVYAAVAGAARALGYVCAPALFQKMIAKCAGRPSDIEEYRKNRDLLYGGLTKIGYECVRPDGAFYLFVKAPDKDDKKFSQNAKEYDILIVPGSDFGCSGYVRVSYCVDADMIKRSLPAFEKLMKEKYNA